MYRDWRQRLSAAWRLRLGESQSTPIERGQPAARSCSTYELRPDDPATHNQGMAGRQGA